jgi:hypothetical protein
MHEAVLLLGSVAWQVTLVVPTGKELPLAGVHTRFTPQASDAVVTHDATALQRPELAVVEMLLGQIIVGGVTSRTVIWKVHEAELALGSRASAVMVVVPTGKTWGVVISVEPM